MYVPLNGTATALEMLRGLLSSPGNDASKAMAEHIAGNEGTFAHMMNQEAKRIGMTNTSFINSTGMPAEGHYSTAKDMATLGTAHHQRQFGILSNLLWKKNLLLMGLSKVTVMPCSMTDPSVDGLKTGHTDEAGYCLTTSSKRGPTTSDFSDFWCTNHE